jgi:hypothetical protein
MKGFYRPFMVYDCLEIETITYHDLRISEANPMTEAQTAALDANIKTIKYGAGITLSSLTLNISGTTSGAVPSFISNPSVDLRPYVGFKVSIAAGGKTLVGWIKAAGSGETLSATEKWLNGNFSSDEPPGTAWVRGAGFVITGGQLVGTTAPVANTYATIAATTGALYKTSADFVITTGTIRFTPASGGIGKELSGTGAYSVYGTAITGFPSPGFRVLTTFTGTIDNASTKQVLTPSTNGATIVSTQGGATYNWTSDGGIVPNSASYTMTVTRN